MKRLLTILCLLIPSLGIKAGTLRGKIIDQDAQPVAGAVITYYSYSDNSILATTTSDVNGNWELSYEEAWNDIQIVARAEGYTSYTLHDCNVSMNHTWPKIIFHLFNAIDYKAGKRSTIYLPEAPDVSWGRFYRLDHEDGNKVVFEREHTPKAYVPYVFFPYQDLHIDISKMDLSDHHDQVRLEHISFSSAINYSEGLPDPGSLVTQPMDETLPYAKYSEEGAIEDYLSPAPMHAILSWMWYDFFEGNEEDGTWQAVSPEFIFHDPEPTTYHTFVEPGKRWCVHGFSMGGQHTVTDYSFSDALEYISHDGHEYFKLVAWSDNKLTEVGELREEKQRVYLYDTEAGKEYLIYDFSLDVGDTFYESRSNRTLTVDSIGQMIVNGGTLKRLYLNDDDGMFTADWVEGIGSLYGPLRNVIGDEPYWSYHLAYVSGSSYWPFTFGLPFNGWWGTNIVKKRELPYDPDIVKEDCKDTLTYEMIPDFEHDSYALHVTGSMWMQCGPNNYIYCVSEPTDDINIIKLTLRKEGVEPQLKGIGLYEVDFRFPYFQKEMTYHITDDLGEHPVAVKDVSYRPLIEEGKVWRTGVTFPNISFSHLYDYYIQGDTIIDNHACKKLMRSELQYPQNYPEHIDTTYAASLYEEGQRVYVVLPGESHLELAYDFASPVGSHIDIDGFNIIVTRKEEKATGCFKGRCTYVGLEEEYEDISFESCWIEGVGVALNPLYSLNELLPTGLLKELLIFCFVNDEVLYYNSDIFDGDIYGLTPQAGEVKKQWIDFTHIKKPRPKSPARKGTAYETDEENLTGEYSTKELFVNLKILSGAYTVTLKDAAGNEVYRKEVQTSSTIALTTDLTKYSEGTYTLVVENSEEQYTATLTLPLDDTAVRDIPSDQIANNKSSNGKCFDLSGRQLSTPPAKGIYIRDGKKVVVR